MKKNMLFLMLFVGSALLFSCKKDSPASTTATDPRDKFVGTWSGNVRIQFPSLTYDETSNDSHVITKSTLNSNQIIIDGETANVNGNSYTYVEFTQTEQDATYGTIVETYNGVGTLNGSNLIESGTVVGVVQGVSVNGTWSSNLVKQ